MNEDEWENSISDDTGFCDFACNELSKLVIDQQTNNANGQIITDVAVPILAVPDATPKENRKGIEKWLKDISMDKYTDVIW
eukprot:CAMPEP_0114670532 /NCGR_PEP_ID=MMETSP0191-20121206/39638_1 /TAXON_ID=126664 /ORGANISM="Sorites sp." /LENGTH=80 /DNA_ID=CAMNT_0001928241 /DNA_START=186 /DNA_END=425 /DNA_ORIENTATION=-